MRRLYYFLFLLLTFNLTATTHFYLVRHGETDWNLQNKLQGQTDIPLNNKGKTQALELAKKLENIPFDICYTSDLKRASETAELIVQKRSLIILKDDRLRERSFGPYEGRSEEECFNALPEEQNKSIESTAAARTRTFQSLEEIAQNHPNQTVLIVTHGGIINIVIKKVLHIEEVQGYIHAQNGSFVHLAYDKQWDLVGTSSVLFPPHIEKRVQEALSGGN